MRVSGAAQPERQAEEGEGIRVVERQVKGWHGRRWGLARRASGKLKRRQAGWLLRRSRRRPHPDRLRVQQLQQLRLRQPPGQRVLHAALQGLQLGLRRRRGRQARRCCGQGEGRQAWCCGQGRAGRQLGSAASFVEVDTNLALAFHRYNQCTGSTIQCQPCGTTSIPPRLSSSSWGRRTARGGAWRARASPWSERGRPAGSGRLRAAGWLRWVGG